MVLNLVKLHRLPGPEKDRLFPVRKLEIDPWYAEYLIPFQDLGNTHVNRNLIGIHAVVVGIMGKMVPPFHTFASFQRLPTQSANAPALGSAGNLRDMPCLSGHGIDAEEDIVCRSLFHVDSQRGSPPGSQGLHRLHGVYPISIISSRVPV